MVWFYGYLFGFVWPGVMWATVYDARWLIGELVEEDAIVLLLVVLRSLAAAALAGAGGAVLLVGREVIQCQCYHGFNVIRSGLS